MDHIRGNNRNQIRMISLEQMVEEESMVRIIDAFVDMLNLEQFDFNYFTLNKEDYLINKLKQLQKMKEKTEMILLNCQKLV